MRRLTISIVMAICLMMAGQRAEAQEFFNLTAAQVRIDDCLPFFTHSFDLPSNYADSVYYVSIEYPEYLDMSDDDVAKYRELASDPSQNEWMGIDVEEEPSESPQIFTNLSLSRRKGRLVVSFVPIVRIDDKYKKLISFKLSLSSYLKESVESSKENEEITCTNKGKSLVVLTRSDASERYASSSVLQSGSWAKIRVPETGVYELTETLIKKAGFSDLSKIKVYGYGGNLQDETLTESYLIETDDLPEADICLYGGRRFFFAEGPISWSAATSSRTTQTRTRNPYSDYGYYFITETDEDVETIDSATFVSQFYPSMCHYNTLYENDVYAWYEGGRNLYDSETFGEGVSRSYTLKSSSTSGSGAIVVTISGNTAMKAQVSINDSLVGTMSISSLSDYDAAKTTTSTYFVYNLQETNTITITQTTSGEMRLDLISLHSNEPVDAPNLSGDIDSPEYVYNITNQNHHADDPVDMVIIIPESQWNLEHAERLKTLHEQYDGMSVRIVPADELYNEFSSGTPDATAYKRYMKMLYDRASDDNLPQYLLLFGDGAWDNRMLSSYWTGYSPEDFLLCFESENSMSEVDCYVADDFYCMLDDDESLGTSVRYTGQPDIAIGRIPARTDSEAEAVIDKTERYLSYEDAGSWMNTLVFMGDDGNDNAHMNDADLAAKVVEEINPAFDVKRVMWDAYERETSSTGNTYPDVAKLLQQYMSSGALVMDYCGHGNPTQISHENVLGISDFEDIESDALPFWVTASCDIMPFDGQEDNIGEAAMFNESGGAVAFYGTTRTVYQSYNSIMNRELMSHLFETVDGERISIGEAIRLTKYNLGSTSSSEGSSSLRDYTTNKLQYTLLGDPAIVLASPTMTAVVDSINGVAADSETQVMSAGTIVEVSGHIAAQTADGEVTSSVATDFSGILTAVVKGAKEEIVCRLNNTTSDGADTAYVYYDRNSTIFRGSDSISSGRFNFTFIVPKDITYSDGTGQILIYGINNSKTLQANGENESLAFNGTGDLPTDSVGPSVYCYLNSTSFTDGGLVNSTPYFVAEITDINGINSAGNGIGHDMQLTIDDDASQTYTLNDYFSFDFGSYTSGTVGYSIPELEEGEHSLQFRVWDILNNSTTSRLSFVVAYNLSPTIIDIDCSDNPATTSTTFLITHDRMGSDVDVLIEIFDMSGRKVWNTSYTDQSADSTTEIEWDLTIDGGRPLGTGVYLYRVKLACEGSHYVSKTKKLIVISNK